MKYSWTCKGVSVGFTSGRVGFIYMLDEQIPQIEDKPLYRPPRAPYGAYYGLPIDAWFSQPIKRDVI
jgi:hypothetical protein